MSAWNLTYKLAGQADITKSFEDWGLNNLKRRLESHACDEVTFDAPGVPFDGTPLFDKYSTVVIQKDGVIWFTGVVTRTPLDASPEEESISYEVSGPWWYLENLVYQMEWVSWDSVTGRLISTLKTNIIIGQNVDGTKMDLGQMITGVLTYCLTTAAEQVPAIAPFAIGNIVPDTIIPFARVTDKTCAQIILDCLHWVPDAVTWFDYTKPVPVLHISLRGELPAVNLTAFGDDSPVDGIKIVPRNDLVVPCVIIKYDQTNTVDGATYIETIVDKFPPAAPDPAFRNLVAHVDLIGGNATFQKQNVTVQDRPINAGDAIAMHWILKRDKVLNAKNGSTPIYDTANIGIQTLTTVISPDDPEAIKPDPGFTLNAMTEELVDGVICDWMKTNDHVYSCVADMKVDLIYNGHDAATAALFTFDPAHPETPTDPGAGILSRDYRFTATNASTKTYEELTNEQVSETPPVGFAEKLYRGLSMLHYEGTITTIEDECSATVGIGTVLNLLGSESRPDWATMNAQVFSIVEEIDLGKTAIRIGPPVTLNAQDMTEMLRAFRGRLFSWQLDQRTTGKASSNVKVQGPGNVPTTSINTSWPSSGLSATPLPYDGYDASDGATPIIKLYFGSHNSLPMTFGGGPLTADIKDSPGVVVAAGSGLITATVIWDNTGTPTTGTINVAAPGTSVVNADGSATGYDLLLAYTATIVDGKAKVTFGPSVGRFRTGTICGDTVSFE